MKKLPLVGSTLPAVFAAKVMDRRELASRNKEGRSRTKREILEALDHSFLPRLYAAIETPIWTDVTASTPAQVFSGPNNPTSTDQYTFEPPKVTSSPCIIPNCILPSVSCFNTGRRQKKKPRNQTGSQLVVEPVDVRGMDNRLTLANIVARALEFPKEPAIPPMAKDLISQLLAKDPARRLRSTMGALAIKHHSFFQGVNWALLRCAKPSREVVSDDSYRDTPVDYY
nr:serine/threonine-protein kinase D6PKL2-like [Tanacetum cinerariifolium]